MTALPPGNRPRRLRAGIGLLLALVLAGAIGAVWLARDDSAMAVAPMADPLVPVQVATAKREDVPIYLSGLGVAQAYNTVTVRPRVAGELQQVLFTEGQMVKKGDLLGVIDPRPFQDALDGATATVEQDEANLANAQVILQRDATLTAKQFTTQETTDDQRTTVLQLQGQLAEDKAAKANAATQLSYTKLVAPIDGRTGIRLTDQGNIVAADDPTGLVVITQIEPISTVSTLPEDNLGAVRDALQAGPVAVTAFTTDGTTNLGEGTLSVVDNQIDQSTGTMRLKSTFPNTDQKLWPGQFVEIRLRLQVQNGATTIPSEALERGPDGFFVYVVKADDTVEARPVTPGQIADGRAVIASGLQAGERVVTSGQYRLEPGTRITANSGPAASDVASGQ